MPKTIEIDQIVIAPDRQRKTFDPGELNTLAESIQSRGLFHPIVLRSVGDAKYLVAGERRLRAITDIWALGGSFKCDLENVASGKIPYVDLAELSPLEAEEAELEENIQRTNLTWQERAAAHQRLATLRARQAEAAGAPPPTVADLALEVRGSSEGVNHDTTRQELIVAKHLDNPEVRAAKSVGDAFKVLKKAEQRAKHQALGARVGATFTAEVHQAFNEDSLALMKTLEAGQFDCILTDPPYGMGADEFGDSGGLAGGTHNYTDDWATAESCYVTLAIEGFRLAKPQAHLYAFCDIDRFPLLKVLFETAGWQVFRTPLIWYKRLASRAPWPELGPQRKYETILYAIKGKRLTLKMAGDVLDFPADTNLGHAAQKPVDLYRELLSRSCLPGDAVFDPFCGSGPIFPAAHELRVRATGVELDTGAYGIAVKRIQDLSKQQEIKV